MLDAVFKALSQMFSKQFRAVFWKSVGLALLLIIALAMGAHYALSWLVTAGQHWSEGALNVTESTTLSVIFWILSIAANLGVVVGLVFLMPAATALVASSFADDIALEVERTYYPDEPVGIAPPILHALIEGMKTALLAVLIYLIALPFLLVGGLGLAIFFFATAFLLGREYFLLAAVRFRPIEEAKAMRRHYQSTIFIAGLFIAALVSIPIVNLATPFFGVAFMVHLHKRLSARRPSYDVSRMR